MEVPIAFLVVAFSTVVAFQGWNLRVLMRIAARIQRLESHVVTTSGKELPRVEEILSLVLLCVIATGCGSPFPKAAQPSQGGSQLRGAIRNATDASNATQTAQSALGTNVAASLAEIRTANAAQPPSEATTFIDAEAALALGMLPEPSPDAPPVKAAKERRRAYQEGRSADAARLYRLAAEAGERDKAEIERLRRAGEASAAALVKAESLLVAELEKSRLANQAIVDAAVAAGKAEVEKVRSENHKTRFRVVLGLAVACFVAAVAVGVLSQGSMLATAALLAGFGVAFAALSTIVSHPWFDRAFLATVAICGSAYAAYRWHKRHDMGAAKKVVSLLEKVELETVPILDDKGKPSTLRQELLGKLDDAEKAAVLALRRNSRAA